MKKQNLLVVGAVIVAVMVMLILKQTDQEKSQPEVESQVQAAGINWQEYDAGLAKARKSNKSILLYFHADWCTYCVKLKQTTFKDQRIMNILEDRFVSISVNTDVNRDLAQDWKIKGLPTMWFLEPDSSRISHIPGYVSAQRFEKILNYVHTRSYETLSFDQFLKSL